MFCTTCGNELKAGERFCTRCGAVVGAGPAPASSPTQGSCPSPAPEPRADSTEASAAMQPLKPSPHAAPKRRRSSRVGLIVGVVGVLVALAVVAGAVAMFNGGIDGLLARFVPADASAVEAEYGSSSRIEIVATTPIVPLGPEDAPLSAYQVRVKQADDPSGRFIMIDELPTLSVTGEDGFTLAEFGSLDEGTYLLSVRGEDGTTYDLPPLVLDSEGEGEVDGGIEVGLPSRSIDTSLLSKRGKYGSFLDALDKDIQAYGDVALTVMQLSEGSFLAWVAGVSYADLVDFGDGVERLVVVSCAEASLAEAQVVEVDDNASVDDFGPRANQYTVSVFEYDALSDESTLAAALNLPQTDSGRPQLRYVKGPSGQTLLVVAGSSEDGSDKVMCFGLSSAGVLDMLVADEADVAQLTTTMVYKFVGEAATQEAALGAAETGERSCEQTAQTVKDLKARLGALAGM